MPFNDHAGNDFGICDSDAGTPKSILEKRNDFSMGNLSRREFHGACAAAAVAATFTPKPLGKSNRPICAFIKFLQELSFDQLADTIAELGFQGVEATVRPGGLIEPENASRDLPKLVDALHKRDLEITVMTTNITDVVKKADQEFLQVAADCGIKRYRMGYFKYDLGRPITPQLDAIRPKLERLATFNRKTQLNAVYQNHEGARNVGATIWDLVKLLTEIDPQQVGMAFDIRHAVATGGNSWPVLWDIAKSHSQVVYVKDFTWSEGRIKNVPLGKGMVPREFIETFSANDKATPISLHVEYLQREGLQNNVKALGADLDVLKNWMTNG